MRKVALFACLFSLLITAVLLAGCGSGGDKSTTQTPQEVAKAFWTAALTGDADTSWEMLSKNMQNTLKDKAKWAKSVSNVPNVSIEVGKATVTGNTAKVTIKILSGGKEATTTDVSLVKENGVWKVKLP
jgi:hypothetical protein